MEHILGAEPKIVLNEELPVEYGHWYQWKEHVLRIPNFFFSILPNVFPQHCTIIIIEGHCLESSTILVIFGDPVIIIIIRSFLVARLQH